MKIAGLIRFSTVLVSLCFIISCGSTSAVPKESVQADAETQIPAEEKSTELQESQQSQESQKTQESQESKDSRDTQEFQESRELQESQESKELQELQELIDESTILKNPVNLDEEVEFTEPVVFDAPPQEEPVTHQVAEPRYTEYEQGNPLSAEDADEIEPVQNTTVVPENAPSAAAPETASEAQKTVVTNTPATATPAGSDTQTKTVQQSDKQSSKNTENKDTDAEEKADTEAKTEQQPDVFKNPAVIVPSRSMTVKNKQYIEVTYPGSGWVFLGETAKDPLFRYFGRKLGNSDTKFTLRSTKAGKTYLHFYKNDVLTSTYIDDYLEVEVENQDAKSNEKATAPSYAEVVPPKPVRTVTQITPEQNAQAQTQAQTQAQAQAQSAEPQAQTKKETKTTAQTKPSVQQEKKSSTENADDKNVKTVIQDTSSPKESVQTESTPVSSPVQKTTIDAPKTNTETAKEAEPEQSSANSTIKIDRSKNLLEEAKKSLKDKKYELALAQIQAYLDSSSAKIDEALYVQGQILEADSPVKNIKNALDSYDTLTKRYPASKFWGPANKRKIFIKRFYIDIY